MVGRMKSPALIAILLPLLTAAPLFAANWPMWRGADGLGTTKERNLPVRWSATENVRWKIELPDRGNSTPAVWGDKVFVTQAIVKDSLRTLMCFDRRNGKLLWQKSTTHEAKEKTHPTNPYCSASPSTDGERVIVCHGSAGVFCYDFEGKELWKRDLGKQDYDWGSGSSPVLHGDVCILYYGPGKDSKLVGLDKKTGKTVWEYAEQDIDVGKRTDGFSSNDEMGKKGGRGMVCTYSTPIVVKAAGRDEVIMSFPRYVRAFDPKTGKELWSCDGLNPLVYTSPLYADGIVVAMGGFFGTSIAVKAGGSGDVTETHRLWQQVRTKAGIGSGVIHDGHIYFLSADGIAECQELKTGKRVWFERAKGSGPKGDSWSSMVLAGDRIYILNQSGDCIVLRASPKFELLAANSIGNEMSNSSIAPSNGEIFIRTHKHLWCIAEGVKSASR